MHRSSDKMLDADMIDAFLKKREAKILMDNIQASNLMNVTIRIIGSQFHYYAATSMARINISEDAEITREEALGRITDAYNERYFS